MLYSSLLVKLAITITSFYSLSFTSINGDTLHMSDYAGKKILLVNTASGSSDVAQYDSLEVLQQQYADSLVVIAFPTNSFGNEHLSIQDIIDYTTLHCPHLVIAAPDAVVGENRNAIYGWLGSQSDNGIISAAPLSDFYKYLINEQGQLIGFFDNSMGSLNW